MRGDKEIKAYLLDKREELIWALSLQDYSNTDISIIFGIKHPTQVLRIVERKPKDWMPKWHKDVD